MRRRAGHAALVLKRRLRPQHRETLRRQTRNHFPVKRGQRAQSAGAVSDKRVTLRSPRTGDERQVIVGAPLRQALALQPTQSAMRDRLGI